MAHEVNLLPAIRCLYDAATDGAKWPVFLKELAHSFCADGAHIVRVQPREHILSFSALYGYDDAILKLYGDGSQNLDRALARFEQHFESLMPTDPRIRVVERFPSRPFSCRLALTDAEIHGSKVYQEMLRHADVEYSLVVNIVEDDGSLIMLGVFRGRQSTFFNAHEADLFGELIPHVKQAVTLSEHLARLDLANCTALAALDSLVVGIFILDEHARLVHANAAAQRIIARADGIAIAGDMVRLQAKDADAALRAAVWDAVAKARTGKAPSGAAISLARPSGKEPFPIVIETLWGNHLRYGLGRLDRPLAVVFVTDPDEPQEAPAELLRRLFGLTCAEARICEQLVRGHALDQIADTLEITTDTVRAHLKSVFAKMGVSRQAELVARILATPVWARYRRSEMPARPVRDGRM